MDPFSSRVSRERGAGRGWRLAILLGLLLAGANGAEAARFHVSSGGTRTSGASQPGNWSDANCYGELSMAAAAMAAADTLLLSPESHPLDVPIVLEGILSRADLGYDPSGTEIRLGGTGSVQVGPRILWSRVRGITFVPAATPTTEPAVRVLAETTGFHRAAVEACRFEGLSGRGGPGVGGAALYVEESSVLRTVQVSDCEFVDNVSSRTGGALSAHDGVDLSLLGCSFLRNQAVYESQPSYGGAVFMETHGTGGSLLLDHTEIAESRNDGPGGGLHVVNAPLTVLDSVIRDNQSGLSSFTSWSAGAGIFVNRTEDSQEAVAVLVERSDFLRNRGDQSEGTGAGDGGGLMLRGNETIGPLDVIVRDCLFEENFNDQGAGLYVGRSVTAEVERCVFLRNTAQRNGGGAYKGGRFAGNRGETARFSYCVFDANRAGWDQNDIPISFGGWGGAFVVRLNPRAEFLNCSFVDNLCGENSGRGDALMFWNEGFAVTEESQRSRIVNSIFYGDTGNDRQVWSEYQSLADVTSTAFEGGEVVALSVPIIDLIPLVASPFASPGDWELLANSDCIDAGVITGSTKDVNGDAVPSGQGPDVGAVEYLQLITAVDPLPGVRGPRLTTWPNPANPRAEIAFELPRASSVKISVHDVRGRHVVDLLNDERPASAGRVVWNGRDHGGRAVASGIYFVRLVADSMTTTTKVVLAR